MGFDHAVIAAAAEVPYARHPSPGLTTLELLARAAGAAVEDAGLARSEVDGIGVCSFSLSPDHALDVAWRLGLDVSWIMEDTSGGVSALNMIHHAIRAVGAGDASAILLLAGGLSNARTVAGVLTNYNSATRDHLSPIPYGGPNAVFALITQRHMERFGLSRADYGQIAVAQRRWASLNPGAVYRQPLSIDDYLHAPIVAEPLGRYDCVPTVTGADAIVITAPDRVRSAPVVRLRALQARHNWDHGESNGLTTGLAAVGDRLWAQAELKPDDIDVLSIYDDYPVMVLVQLADLRFISDDDPGRFARVRIAEARLALNTSGGMLSAGQATGNGGMHGAVEVITQLRGRAGARQVPGARFGLVTGLGGVTYRHASGAIVAVLERVDDETA